MSLKKLISVGPLCTITLSVGEYEVPQLTNLKLIKLAKFLATDVSTFMEKYQNKIDENTNMAKSISIIANELDPQQVAELLAILLDEEVETILALNPVDTIQILDTFVDHTEITKVFTVVQNLIEKFK